MDEYAKGPGISVIEDLNKVAVFGVGMIGAEGPAVLDSATNKTRLPRHDPLWWRPGGRTMDIAGKMLAGEITKIIYDPLDIVTVIDGKLMVYRIDDTEVFRVPTAAAGGSAAWAAARIIPHSLSEGQIWYDSRCR